MRLIRRSILKRYNINKISRECHNHSNKNEIFHFNGRQINIKSFKLATIISGMAFSLSNDHKDDIKIVDQPLTSTAIAGIYGYFSLFLFELMSFPYNLPIPIVLSLATIYNIQKTYNNNK